MIKTAMIRRPRRMARDAEFITSASVSAEHNANIANSKRSIPGAAVKAQTKAGLVEGLLRRDEGASVQELCEATGWLPHTCRAFLTGLRNRGIAPEKAKRNDGVTFYRLEQPGLPV